MQKKSKKPPDLELLAALPVAVDSILLTDKFSSFENVRKKVFDLARKGYLFPVRRGFYFNLKSSEFKNVVVERLANSLYYPSYISAEWALQYYGLLTDRTHTITSVTTRRSAEFRTPLGTFSYDHIKKGRYTPGCTLDSKLSFLIALPEKALIDFISLRVGAVRWKSSLEIEEFLNEDLRIKVDTLIERAELSQLVELAPHYHRNSIEAKILRWLTHQKENQNG